MNTTIPSVVNTIIQYLQRDERFATEKPFSAEFDIGKIPGVVQSNYVLAPVSVQIVGISGNSIDSIDSADSVDSANGADSLQFTLDRNGFCIIKAETHVPAADLLLNRAAVEEAYLAEVAAHITQRYPEYKRVEPIEMAVRKRHENFPSDTKALITHQQPACVAHSDYSTRGAMLQMERSFSGQTSYFDGKEFDMINVWRPLVGPNSDWPLALCDFASISAAEDALPADRLFVDSVGENQLLLPSQSHRWYYIEGQQPHHLLVFRNTDSTGNRAKAFHAAFHNPASQAPPRQSCEARFVAIR